EKIRNPHTGEHENPDERMMREVEGLIGVKQKQEDHRRGLISTIAAYAIDHPGDKIVNSIVFPQQLRKVREAVFTERRKGVASVVRDLVGILRSRSQRSEGTLDGLHEEQRKNASTALDRLKTMGYCESCALDAASVLLRARFAELVT
ncbi:MAG TPA: serine protein kinase PrkA, partial [Polyangiaceae bacterium]|nr:serine protein kinase PrkA [Polyangiaceae bacterium]